MELARSHGHAIIFSTDLGWMGLLGSSDGVRQVTFGHASESEVRRSLPRECQQVDANALLTEVSDLLRGYAAGDPVDLSVIPIDLPPSTEFRTRVRTVVRGIPSGETLTYGQVADLAGHPGAARAVGTVMSTNPVPLLIPCHRVVGAAGGLGGYTSPQGLAMKRRLLALERRASGWESSRNL